MKTPTVKVCLCVSWLLVMGLMTSSVIAGTIQLQTLLLSPDLSLEWIDRDIDDQQLGSLDIAGNTVGFVNVRFMPDGADLSGYHRFPSGVVLFVVTRTTEMTNGFVLEPRDVGRVEGSTTSLQFDGSAEGIPDGVRIDAVTWQTSGLTVSFDQTIDVPGLGPVDDEDLVTFDLDDDPFLSLDASMAGIDPALDLDGAHKDPELTFLSVSFDSSGVVDGISFDDEDVLSWDPIENSWSLLFDASASDAEWEALDADAVFATFEEVPQGPLLSDGFETGDTSRWSEVTQ